MKRKVLMVVYYYPPIGGIGSMRALRLAKRLPALGWEPLVLTVSENTLAVISCDASQGILDGVSVFRTYNTDLAFRLKARVGFDVSRTVDRALAATDGNPGLKARMAASASEWLGIPDRMVDWFPFARHGGMEICREHSPEVIFSCAPPNTCHLVAASLKRRTGILWVADMRDTWIHEFYSTGTGVPGRVNTWLEKRTLSEADVVTVVSEPILQDIARKIAVPVEHIPNSYDEELLASVKPIVENDFNILYAGSLFFPRRDPRPVFRAMRRMREDGTDISAIKVRFAGNDAGIAGELAEREGVRDNVEILGLLSPRETIAREKGASALLYIQPFNEDPASRTHVLAESPTGKLYEYIGADRPILSLMPSAGSAETLLRETGAGEIAKSDADVRDILQRWLLEYQSKGTLSSNANVAIDTFSSNAMAGRFASLFERLSKH